MPSQPRCPTYGGTKKRSGSASTSVACNPGGAAHQIAKRPSPWWFRSTIRKARFPRTKNVGAPCESRSLVSGSARQSSRSRARIRSRLRASMAVFSRHGRSSADRRLPLRRRPLRGDRAARLGRLLPLHALPAPDRIGGGGLRARGAGIAARDQGRGADRVVGPAGRVQEVLLLGLRRRAVGAERGGSGRDLGADGHVRRRPRNPPVVPPV